MNEVTTIGLDLAKNVFQIHGVDASGRVVIRRQLGRGRAWINLGELKRDLIDLWIGKRNTLAKEVMTGIEARRRRDEDDGRASVALHQGAGRQNLSPAGRRLQVTRHRARRHEIGRYRYINRDWIAYPAQPYCPLSLHFLFNDIAQYQKSYRPNSYPNSQPLCMSFL